MEGLPIGRHLHLRAASGEQVGAELWECQGWALAPTGRGLACCCHLPPPNGLERLAREGSACAWQGITLPD